MDNSNNQDPNKDIETDTELEIEQKLKEAEKLAEAHFINSHDLDWVNDLVQDEVEKQHIPFLAFS